MKTAYLIHQITSKGSWEQRNEVAVADVVQTIFF